MEANATCISCFSSSINLPRRPISPNWLCYRLYRTFTCYAWVIVRFQLFQMIVLQAVVCGIIEERLNAYYSITALPIGTLRRKSEAWPLSFSAIFRDGTCSSVLIQSLCRVGYFRPYRVNRLNRFLYRVLSVKYLNSYTILARNWIISYHTRIHKLNMYIVS